MNVIEDTLAAFGPDERRYPIVKGEDGVTEYGPWRIYYDPPPIPDRSFDWQFYHDNYEGFTDDEGDWTDNGLAGEAGSFADALNAIDALEDEQA